MVSYICSLVANDGGGPIVLIAAIMTIGLVTALTIFAFAVPVDLHMCWGLGFCLLIGMLFLGIFSWIAWTPFLNTLYCSLGVIVFGIFIVVDTKLIAGNDRKIKLSMDDYVVGALMLYIDIIQIFLYLLMLLGGSRR